MVGWYGMVCSAVRGNWVLFIFKSNQSSCLCSPSSQYQEVPPPVTMYSTVSTQSCLSSSQFPFIQFICKLGCKCQIAGRDRFDLFFIILLLGVNVYNFLYRF